MNHFRTPRTRTLMVDLTELASTKTSPRSTRAAHIAQSIQHDGIGLVSAQIDFPYIHPDIVQALDLGVADHHALLAAQHVDHLARASPTRRR